MDKLQFIHLIMCIHSQEIIILQALEWYFEEMKVRQRNVV
jgi:hypothetical protein